MISKPKMILNDDSSEQEEEILRDLDPDEDDQPYFPLEESKPPHY